MTSSASKAMSFHSGELTIAGSFVDVAEPRAATLILSGSGKLDRDSNKPQAEDRGERSDCPNSPG
jgi:hypothetical protein